jgi:hypothetical protein
MAATAYFGQIYTPNGQNLVTAVNGGGLAGSVAGVALNTNAAAAGAFETFKLILQPGSSPIGTSGMKFALQTSAGNYVTAINAGGVGGPNNATCPVHTDATIANAWEGFTINVVDDSVSPPNVTIQTQTNSFVTAVNGGGINGGNTQPIHTDAAVVGTWEQFLFNLVAVVKPSFTLTYNTNINGPANGNIATTAPISLTLNSNGTWSLTGTFNNSNWLPYSMAVVIVIRGAQGTALRFGATGSIDAGLPWDNNNWTFHLTGTNNQITAAWDELMTGWTFRAEASAALTLSGVFNAIQTSFNAAGTALKVIETIVGIFS